ncbi:o-succinylbenzoate--CoA ligase [Gracilibacillus timonensis]|uniref:o-succinylbenzoate--CoA ligase n=1 Tax=Gracilibacillus timonensis TaxID=1816696 RepID=UPI00082416EF|nr:o-succinylbenzoate--CoA ligase [Gracilibacillus timonensis]
MEHWLTKRALLTPEQTALELADGQRLSFRVLRERALSFAEHLARLDIKQQVAILSHNSVDMVVALWACTYLQTPVVFLNTKLTNAEWKKQCEDAHVSTIITSELLRKQAESLPVVVVTFAMVKELSALPGTVKETMKEEAICSMMFTSGTTGRAKAVQHSYGNHWASAIASVLNLGLTTDDKWLACLPLFHIGGLSILFKSVIYGMPVYLLERFDEEQVHQAIMHQRVTMISVVALTCARLLERLGDEQYPETFRCMLLGGGSAPEPLLKKAEQKQVPVIQTYGMTETSSQVVTLHETEALRKLGSAGKPLFSASLQIRDGHKALPAKQVGEIAVQGPMITPGYYQADASNQAVFHDGWFYTGDLGFLDEEGFLFVVDRRSDLIISGGENVYPAEIEAVLLAFAGVVEAGVTGRTDAKWGKVPVAYVVVSDPAITENALQAHCEQQLATFKVPKQIFFRKHLPRNATKKLQRYKLQ